MHASIYLFKGKLIFFYLFRRNLNWFKDDIYIVMNFQEKNIKVHACVKLLFNALELYLFSINVLILILFEHIYIYFLFSLNPN